MAQHAFMEASDDRSADMHDSLRSTALSRRTVGIIE